jgi:capsular polysaccharide biosynthesis protein
MSEAAPPAAYAPAAPDRSSIVWKAKWWIMLIALLAGGATYAVCTHAVPKRYSSSTTIAVNVHSISGGISDAITASNDLAAQYAELVDSPPVLAHAAASLHGGSGLGSSISAGTIADQNLISVDAQGASATTAQHRANAVGSAFVRYINGVNLAQASRLSSSIPARLSASQKAILDAETAVEQARKNAVNAPPSEAASANSVLSTKESLLATLIAQRQAVLDALAEGAVASLPTVRIAAVAGPGSQVEPKPVLYGVIAAMVAALLGAEAFILAGQRRA